MSAEQIAKLFIIRIKSGPHAGRYAGMGFGGGLVTNPEVQNNPPVNVPGYGLWAQEAAATRFFEHAVHGAAANLTELGYEVDMIQVQ
jgi:hypothetical protein